VRRDAANERSSALPHTAERLVPWFGSAVLIGGLNVIVALAGAEPTVAERAFMILGLSVVLAVAALVAVRSNREIAHFDREERERPALDQLMAAAERRELTGTTYVETMARWAEAMVELADHTARTDAAQQAGLAGELRAAADDGRELAQLLHASLEAPLAANDMAILHNLCAVWEADQARVEALAARVDPQWHRRWRARTVVERLVRGGGRQTDIGDLPYRSPDWQGAQGADANQEAAWLSLTP
jgi:hypothetical protein